jgi:hypothetical protein
MIRREFIQIAAFAALLLLAVGSAFAQSCPSSTPLHCSAGWCCAAGDGGRTDVCCDSNPQSQGCTRNGICGTSQTTTTTSQSCPSSAPLRCNGGWCCPYGGGGRTDVCCDSNGQSQGCTANGSCGTTTSPPPSSTTAPTTTQSDDMTCASDYMDGCENKACTDGNNVWEYVQGDLVCSCSYDCASCLDEASRRLNDCANPPMSCQVAAGRKARWPTSLILSAAVGLGALFLWRRRRRA